MKKSIQTLVFALLLGVAFTSCSKKSDVSPVCFEDAFSPVTYKSGSGDSDVKVQKNSCTSVTLFYTIKNVSGATNTETVEVALTNLASGRYVGTTKGTLIIPSGSIVMEISATKLTVGGAFLFTGTK